VLVVDAAFFVALILAAVSVVPAYAVTAPELVAQADRLVEAPDASVESLQHAVLLYGEAARLEPARAEIHLKHAAAALEAADATASDPLRWYEVGRQAAERAVALDHGNAHAHFLLAAHRGQIAKRRLVAPSIVGELEEHLRRCLALNPRHSRALHMMGRLLRDTPIVLRPYLKGSRADVERYLAASVEADPNFPQARLDLAEHYRSQGHLSQARAQAQAVIDMVRPTNVRTWRALHRPAAEALLKTLAGDQP
jgi:cytochrome c-type biogenesis protein CcmH/NrfG